MQQRPERDPRRAPTRSAHRVYVRAGALALERPGDRRAPVASLPAPDAERALETLREFGYEVVLMPPDAASADLAPRDWLLTDQPDDCRWARRAGARTVLVGADAAEQAAQPDRCDLTVGSVYGAAIEIVIGEPEAPRARDGGDLQPGVHRQVADAPTNVSDPAGGPARDAVQEPRA